MLVGAALAAQAALFGLITGLRLWWSAWRLLQYPLAAQLACCGEPYPEVVCLPPSCQLRSASTLSDLVLAWCRHWPREYEHDARQHCHQGPH